MADAVILDGCRPGSIAGITGLHADYYARNWNFGVPFEAKVAHELGEFVSRMDASRDLLLTAWRGNALLGSIVMDVSEGGEYGAHLRWFIVSDSARGTGLGGELMRRAMAHADMHTGGRAWLTTFAGLDAARALYERHGFRLLREEDNDQWQGGVREQLFRRP